jgi:pantoate--beta-alanine ligase
VSARVLRTVAEVREFTAQLRARGHRIAAVPTMGYLHEGHLSLIREGKRRAGACLASIFVNPTQFGPKEDLSRYPRDLEGDVRKCESAGVDAVFHPDVAEIYPRGFQTFVEVTEVSQGLCGEKRPGHFRGVATVVTKLLNIFRPDLALFGEKDYQQLQVIKTLARDLDLGVEILGMPTIREADGLAMSSRNAYLKPDERIRALALSRGLFAAQRRVREAGGSPTASGALVQLLRDELRAAEVREDYIEVVHADTLRPLAEVAPGAPARLLVAGFLGTTRLIDNVPLD